MPNRVVITGAAGLVGQNLVQRLVREGYHIIALDKHAGNLRLLQTLNPLIETHVADLSRHGQWENEFRKGDIVVQLQAVIVSKKQTDLLRNNINSVRNVLTTSRRAEINHLVHVSSTIVATTANDPYACTKRMTEKLVKKSGLPYTILRPSLMYGCFDVKHLGWLIGFLDKSPVFPIPGRGRIPRQPLYAGNLCEVILACIKKGPTYTTHNIVGMEKIDYVDIIKSISMEKGLKRLFVRLPIPIFRMSLQIYDFMLRTPMFTTAQLDSLIAADVFPIEPWSETFGVEFTSFRIGIRQTLNSPYYRYRDIMTSPY